MQRWGQWSTRQGWLRQIENIAFSKDHMVDYDGKEYLVFEVAALKESDQFGKTHTAYISKKIAAPKAGKARRSKT
ncbi:hypothetical protein [Cyclobacterium roseum]|uniref:hypothetical protein n=1 Tax=Cyclobacterium roseum TaxID=2666137 RepID=UPI0013916320|nr:hypothetical protein [Cyclobacterium roseum]